MTNTRRSLMLALVASVFTFLFIKSPVLFPTLSWLTRSLPFGLFVASSWGLVLGIRSLKEQGNIWSWLAVVLNGLLLTGLFLFVIFLLEAGPLFK